MSLYIQQFITVITLQQMLEISPAMNVCVVSSAKVVLSCRLSVSNDLRVDAERDLRDISASRIEVYPLNKVCSLRVLYHLFITLTDVGLFSWS